MLSVSLGRAEDRMVFHWELEAAFLWEVTLGLVEAENREAGSKKHTHAGEGKGGTTATPSATTWTPDPTGFEGISFSTRPLWILALGPGRQRE